MPAWPYDILPETRLDKVSQPPVPQSDIFPTVSPSREYEHPGHVKRYPGVRGVGQETLRGGWRM